MAIVSRTSINALIEKGDIVVHPLDKSRIGNCSIDVRLGQWYFREKKFNCLEYVYPYSTETLDGADISPWDPEAKIAKPMNPRRDNGRECHQVPNTDFPVIVVRSGETILATTEEFIGSRRECTTMLKTKSTLARLGLDLCGSSGWGDIGYINRWAFPLHNKSNHTIILQPGTWIGQIVFLKVTDDELSYSQGGNYQPTDDIDKLINEWKPESVLPKPLTFSH